MLICCANNAIVDAVFDASLDKALSVFLDDEVTEVSLGISGYGAFFQPAHLRQIICFNHCAHG